MTESPDLVDTLTEYGLQLLKDAETAPADEGPSMTEKIKLLDAMTRLASLRIKEGKNEPKRPGIKQYRAIFERSGAAHDADRGTANGTGSVAAKPRAARAPARPRADS